MEQSIPIFSTIEEKRRYYRAKKFNRQPKSENVIKQEPIITKSETDTLKVVTEAVETVYPSSTTNTIQAIPYFTNHISGVNIFKESRSTIKPNQSLTVHDILLGLISAKLNISYEKLLNEIDLDTILIKLAYPISMTQSQNCASMTYSSSIEPNDDYSTMTISDPILYAMMKDHSKHIISVSTSDDLFILGRDIMKETGILTRSTFDAYFITMAKTIFSTTLLGRNVDLLGLMDFPSYQFSLGTYSVDGVKNDTFRIIRASQSLVHVLPLWDSVFSASFLIELTTTKFEFSYQHDTMFSHFERDIPTSCFPQMSDRTESIMNVPARLSLTEKDESVSDYDVYTANVRIRNTISSNLDHIKNFNKVKDTLYPKDNQGAKTKLKSIFSFMDLSTLSTVLDIGTAPGTWIDHLIDMNCFSSIHGVTRKQKNDLHIYDRINSKIADNKHVQLIYDDGVDYLRNCVSKYDLIVSDVATKAKNYVTQSYEHDHMYELLLPAIVDKLNHNGSMVMKMFDMTDKMKIVVKAISKYFLQFAVIKPYGSCPTNSEVYLIGQGYNADLNNTHNHIIPCFNEILYLQISHLNYLITKGFNINISYKLNYIHNRLKITDINALPYHLVPCIQSLRFSEYLYPNFLSCTLYDEKTLLNDRYLRFKWDVPVIPQENMRYIIETNIGYESKGISLQRTFMTHYGMILEGGVFKYFFIIEKEAACLFSDKYDQLCVTKTKSSYLPPNQVTIDDLIIMPNFKQLFPSIFTFHDLAYHIRQLCLTTLLDYQNMYAVHSSKIIMTQFFREAETMYLHYTKANLQTIIKRSEDTRTVETFDMYKINDRKVFYEKYKANISMGNSVRQTFQLLLDQYSIQIGENEFFETSFCTTESSYIERTTRQICISQPACIQLRRQKYI